MNTSKKNQLHTHKTKASKLLMEEKYSETLKMIEPVIRYGGPEDVEILTTMAHCYSGLGDPQRALFLCDKALTHQPGYLHAKFLKGCLLGDLGDYQQGIALVQDVIKNGLDNFESYGNLGVLYQDSGNFASAVDAFEKALTFPPIGNVENLEIRLANCYSELGQFPAALQIYDKWINSNSRDTYALYNKAITYDKMENSTEFLRLLKDVVSIDQDFLKAWYELEQLYTNLGFKKEADNCRRKIEEIKSNNK